MLNKAPTIPLVNKKIRQKTFPSIICNDFQELSISNRYLFASFAGILQEKLEKAFVRREKDPRQDLYVLYFQNIEEPVTLTALELIRIHQATGMWN